MSDEAPPRLDMDEGVPELAARALRAARDDVPDDDHLRRVEGLLMARLALSAAGTGGGPSGGGNPGASGPPPGTAAGGAGATGAGGATGGAASGISASMIGGGLAIVALVFGGLLASQLSSSTPSAEAPEAPAVTAPRVVVTPPSAFVPPTATSEKVVSVDDLPRAVTPSATAQASPSVAPSAAKTGPVDPAEETRLVSDAQKNLRTDPAATLRACNDHARKFPGGALAQERDALAIEALVALGRKPEARTKLETFRTTYPGSGHLRKLDALF